MDWRYLLLLMVAYAAIPALPAAVLRIKAPATAYNVLTTVGIMLGVVCLLIIIFAGDAAMEDHEWLTQFAQCALFSTVPVLFCAAFAGTSKVWIAAAPSLFYFLGLFMRHFMAVGFAGMINDIFGGMMMLALGMSVIFFIWAVVCIYAAKGIYKVAKRIKNKIDGKKQGQIRAAD